LSSPRGGCMAAVPRLACELRVHRQPARLTSAGAASTMGSHASRPRRHQHQPATLSRPSARDHRTGTSAASAGTLPGRAPWLAGRHRSGYAWP
jgi:hypothetical protein